MRVKHHSASGRSGPVVARPGQAPTVEPVKQVVIKSIVKETKVMMVQEVVADSDPYDSRTIVAIGDEFRARPYLGWMYKWLTPYVWDPTDPDAPDVPLIFDCTYRAPDGVWEIELILRFANAVWTGDERQGGGGG